MASFAMDRDLLVLEPNLFRDVGWAGQRLTRGAATVAGTTLTLASPEVALDAAGVGAGHVVVVGGTAYEVITRLGPTQATISRLRAWSGDLVIPPSASVAGEAAVHTFAPQIAEAHRQVLASAKLEPDGSPGALAGARREGQVLVDAAVVRLEALGALAGVWAAAAAGLEETSPAASRARWYAERFDRERERVEVRLDLDGDGIADDFIRLRWSRLRRG